MAADFSFSIFGLQAGQTTDVKERLRPCAMVAVSRSGSTAIVALSTTADGTLSAIGSSASFTNVGVTGEIGSIQNELQDLCSPDGVGSPTQPCSGFRICRASHRSIEAGRRETRSLS